MVCQTKKYFTIFGILAATVSKKLQSICCSMHSIIINNVPKILNILLSTQLKPIKLYSTNNIKVK